MIVLIRVGRISGQAFQKANSFAVLMAPHDDLSVFEFVSRGLLILNKEPSIALAVFLPDVRADRNQAVTSAPHLLNPWHSVDRLASRSRTGIQGEIGHQVEFGPVVPAIEELEV